MHILNAWPRASSQWTWLPFPSSTDAFTFACYAAEYLCPVESLKIRDTPDFILSVEPSRAKTRIRWMKYFPWSPWAEFKEGSKNSVIKINNIWSSILKIKMNALGGERVLKLDSDDGYTNVNILKNHWIVHFKRMNFMVCELCFNKVVI